VKVAKSNESLWWAPSTGGAVVSAFLMPITVVVLGVLTFCAWLNDREIWHLLQNPWIRAYLFILITLSLFHGFHRILSILSDCGLRERYGLLSVICYGSAIAGMIVALLLVLHAWPRAEPPAKPPIPAEGALFRPPA
jgi:fumarate reductase subunit D